MITNSSVSDQLTGAVYRPADLEAGVRQAMFALLHTFFENVTRDQFKQDLSEKEWVFVFTDSAGRVQGFSTLMRIDLLVDDRPVVAVYSGDTIIHPDFWHEMELPKLWGKHVFDLADEVYARQPKAEVYWFLISSGYKTYRFLPVFFESFYPSYRQPTPPHMQRVLDALAHSKFGDQYDAASGIIRFPASSPLRAGVAELDERRLKNPDIAFFVERNPHHADGDQLACLVKIERTNITAAGRRMLGLDRQAPA